MKIILSKKILSICNMIVTSAVSFFILANLVSGNPSGSPLRLFPLETPLAHAGIVARLNNYNDYISDSDNVSPILSILDGSSLDIDLNAKSNFVLNLNRNVDQDIHIIVSIYSGPNLIGFPQSSKISPEDVKSITVTYEANTFGDKIIRFESKSTPGHAEIVCMLDRQALKKDVLIDDSQAYISINIHRNKNLSVIIQIVGWIYFFAWSASFYFQIILNYQRKSVIGLNFDFVALNLLGFTCYSIYNISLLFSRSVQNDYYKRYTYTRIPVEYNDLFFSLHAFMTTLATLVQCFFYDRGEQKVSRPTFSFLGIATVLGLGLYVASLLDQLSVLDVVLYLSYVKLAITIIKYIPQAFMNYSRKETSGWSIHNILLDFTGGSFSLAQMFLLAYQYNDWISIFGNFTKFGLGVVSISFDIIFMVQHYILYRSSSALDDSIDQLNPVISESIRSLSYTPQQHQPPTPGLRHGARFAPHNAGDDDESERGSVDDADAAQQGNNEGINNRSPIA